jgi:hypothetical protein
MTQEKRNWQHKKERTAPLSIQFNQGKYAFTKGWLGNPNNPDTAQGKEWQRGFNTAYFDNLEKFKLV